MLSRDRLLSYLVTVILAAGAGFGGGFLGTSFHLGPRGAQGAPGAHWARRRTRPDWRSRPSWIARPIWTYWPTRPNWTCWHRPLRPRILQPQRLRGRLQGESERTLCIWRPLRLGDSVRTDLVGTERCVLTSDLTAMPAL
jgi:hypothetical protein